MMDMLRPGQIYNVTNPENTAQGVICCVRRQTSDHYLSVNGNEYECWHHTSKCTGPWILQSVFLVGLTTTDTHKEQHVSTSVGQLQQHLTQSDVFLQQTAMGDET